MAGKANQHEKVFDQIKLIEFKSTFSGNCILDLVIWDFIWHLSFDI